MKFSLLLSAFLLSVTFSCTPKNSMDAQSNTVEKQTMKQAKSHTLELKKGELLVVAIADQKDGKEELLQQYFGSVMPVGMKNGLAFLGQFHIDNIIKANFTPNNFIGLFKWPDMASVMAFSTEISPEQIRELRMPIWNEFKGHMIALQEDKNLVVDENKLYEVKTLWTKDMVNVNSVSKNGGRIILNQPIAGYEDLLGNDAPNHILIIEWKDKKTADLFNKMDILKPKKEESFYTHFTLFPQG